MLTKASMLALNSKRPRKASTDARSKLEATTPLLDKARGDYEKLTKASTDARSKLEATTPLFDKARGEYETSKLQ
jgi:hypothetical protein